MKKLISHALLLSFIFLSCSSSNEKKENNPFIGTAMTMEYKIIVGEALTNDQTLKIQKIINDTFTEVNTIYNKWNPKSELSKLNQIKKDEKVQISAKLEHLLKETDKIVLLSQGLFDPTIEPLQSLWKEKFKQGIRPTAHEITQKMQSIGWDKIHIENGYFHKDHDETSLDLGGIAKGFAVDLLVLRLNEANYPNVFVEWGGEIKATGMHPDNRPWHIFISKLENKDPSKAIAHVDIHNQAIATSGDYLQYWTIKENNKLKNYFHIFDPKKGEPLEIKRSSIASASVVANSCLVADAIATVLMMFDEKEEAVSFGESLKGVYPEMEFWIISRN